MNSDQVVSRSRNVLGGGETSVGFYSLFCTLQVQPFERQDSISRSVHQQCSQERFSIWKLLHSFFGLIDQFLRGIGAGRLVVHFGVSFEARMSSRNWAAAFSSLNEFPCTLRRFILRLMRETKIRIGSLSRLSKELDDFSNFRDSRG